MSKAYRRILKESSVICLQNRYARAMEINTAQVRAARVLLDWTQVDLAKAAKISLPTVKRYEAGTRTPIPTMLAAIRCALEDAGIDFIPAKNGRGVGVRLRQNTQ